MAAYTNWTDAEVFRLIQVWSEEGIQEQLEGAKRNKHIYDQLAEELIVYGIEKTGEQCRTKVKKLRQEYKKLADKHKETGQGRTKWKFFDKLNEFLSAKPATHPPIVLDNSTINNVAAESPLVEEEVPPGDHNDSNGEGHSNASDEAGDMIENTQPSASDMPPLPSDTPLSTSDTPSLASGTSPSDKSTTSSSKLKVGKKRKRNKGEIMEDMMTKVMKSVTDSLQNSDRMFLEMEERRMKFEAEQRKEEREFQLRMAQMYSTSQRGHGSGYYPSFPPPSPSEFYYGPDNS